MKLTKKELINHLDKYPEDYEINLSHYFLVGVTPSIKGRNKGKEAFVQARVDLPIVGTAADKDTKEIRLVLNTSNSEALERIERGEVHPLPSVGDVDDDTVDDVEKKVASA